MLKNQVNSIDLITIRDELLIECEADLADIAGRFDAAAIEYLPDADMVDIEFPVAVYPTKVKSFNFDKKPEVSGVLQGIKGQYLIFDSGVINIRKFAGYEVELEV